MHRLTDNIAREVYPRFSPDGKWIAFASNRYGNYDVFVVPAAGGAPRRLTFHTGNDEVVGWSRDSQHMFFRAARGDGAFPSVAVIYQIPAAGGMEKPLPLDWGYWASYSPDGKSLVFNRHPATWSRQHYRGSYAADLWVANLADKTYTKLLGDEQYNRYWPMWGADNSIYFVGDPLPNDKSVKPGSPEVRKSANNIYKIPASGGGQPTQVTKHADGNVFWPSMSSDGKVIVYEDNFGIWKLDVASGRTSEIKLDIVDRREGQRGRDRDRHQRSRRVRHLAVGPPRGDLGARPDPHHRHRSRRHHPGQPGQDGVAQRLAEMVGRRQIRGLRLGHELLAQRDRLGPVAHFHLRGRHRLAHGLDALHGVRTGAREPHDALAGHDPVWPSARGDRLTRDLVRLGVDHRPTSPAC